LSNSVSRDFKIIPFAFGLVVIVVIAILSYAIYESNSGTTVYTVPVGLLLLVHYLFEKSGLYDQWIISRPRSKTKQAKPEAKPEDLYSCKFCRRVFTPKWENRESGLGEKYRLAICPNCKKENTSGLTDPYPFR